MPKRKTFEEFEEEVNLIGNREFKVFPPYNGNKQKMKFLHLVCNHSFSMRPNNFINGQRCPYCSKESSSRSRRKTTEQFISEVNNCWGKDSYQVLGEYAGADKAIKVKHIKCGTIYNARPADLIRGHGCLKCSYKTRSSKIGISQRSSLSEVKTDINNRLGNDYLVLTKDEDYKGNRQKLKIKHTKCGFIFKERYADIWQYSYGCPRCSKSSNAEYKINTILKQDLKLGKNVDYYYQYSIPDLSELRYAHLDFYFPKSKIGIEYDGKQHYIPVDFYGGISGYYKQQERDLLKTKYCIDNDILLFRIPYTITSYSKLKSKVINILKFVNKRL